MRYVPGMGMQMRALMSVAAIAALLSCASVKSAPQPVSTPMSDTMCPGTAELVARLPTLTVEFEVLGEHDAPIEGADVSLRGGEGADVLLLGGNVCPGVVGGTARTDSAGRATLTIPILDRIEINVRKGDWSVREQVRDTHERVQSRRYYLGSAATMRIRVADAGGAPIGGARLFIDRSGPEAMTGADGEVLVANVVPGEHQIEIKASNHLNKRRTVVARPGAEAVLDFSLEQAGAVDVTCLCDGQPCEVAELEFHGVFVAADGPTAAIDDIANEPARCDEHGRAHRDNLPAGTIEITGLAGSRSPHERTGVVRVTIVPGQTQTVTLPMVKTGAFAATVEGTVTTFDGRPAIGASVSADCGTWPTARTDDAGRFRIDGLPPGPCDLRAWPAQVGCPSGAKCAGTPIPAQAHVTAPGEVDIRLRDPGAPPKPGDERLNFDRP